MDPRDSLLGGKQPVPKDHRFKFTLDYNSQMTDNVLCEYMRIEVQTFRDTILQPGVMSSIRTDSTVQDDNSRSGNDTDADDADIKPIYDKEMVEVDSYRTKKDIQLLDRQVDSEPPHVQNARIS
ncbi:hypothetical protein Tco_0799003 [Tanacetum coccineum]